MAREAGGGRRAPPRRSGGAGQRPALKMPAGAHGVRPGTACTARRAGAAWGMGGPHEAPAGGLGAKPAFSAGATAPDPVAVPRPGLAGLRARGGARCAPWHGVHGTPRRRGVGHGGSPRSAGGGVGGEAGFLSRGDCPGPRRGPSPGSRRAPCPRGRTVCALARRARHAAPARRGAWGVPTKRRRGGWGRSRLSQPGRLPRTPSRSLARVSPGSVPAGAHGVRPGTACTARRAGAAWGMGGPHEAPAGGSGAKPPSY